MFIQSWRDVYPLIAYALAILYTGRDSACLRSNRDKSHRMCIYTAEKEWYMRGFFAKYGNKYIRIFIYGVNQVNHSNLLTHCILSALLRNVHLEYPVLHTVVYELLLIIKTSIHGGRVAKALACNTRDDGFAPHLRRYFRDLFLESIQSPARTDLKWSVWHCGN